MYQENLLFDINTNIIKYVNIVWRKKMNILAAFIHFVSMTYEQSTQYDQNVYGVGYAST